ncbi:MAG: enoyl-CoA hydratase/isomerase family protein [Actinomycetota bacterium]|nr:hypothetical protein [Acidimicrobiaceae bacterium]MCH2624465.1 enoyl-CoA hydratase/isomerase family protein [Acidimicrobiales bacterium]MEC7872873.1 enoyl-CoA hydratase/isomerase family protein [Actinomycetota bacterium]MEC8921024.1 enoyl-CoA hydratase/isomerase family protein [Actinomycetota bacterium]MEC8975464.1 enoyl-CoA hydratase/isomerase family protein [Actinomycetota bacterium]
MTDRVSLSFSDEGVASVAISNPPLNIYDLEMRDGLIESIAAVRDNPDVRCLLLRAEGSNFSAGADLTEFGSASSIFEGRRIRWDRDPWLPLLGLSVPTIAALKGYTVGSGLEMAMLCDLRIAATDVVMGLPETKLGMLPAAGGTQSLTRLVGPDAACPVVLTGRNLDIEEALELGIVTEATGPAELDRTAEQRAAQLALLDPDIAMKLRRCIAASKDLPLPLGLQFERRLALMD